MLINNIGKHSQGEHPAGTDGVSSISKLEAPRISVLKEEIKNDPERFRNEKGGKVVMGRNEEVK